MGWGKLKSGGVEKTGCDFQIRSFFVLKKHQIG
jgi:hypothetical protein